MRPWGWLILFLVGSTVGELAAPFLRSRFPLSLMQHRADQSRSSSLLRLISSSVIFGGIVGLLVGWLALLLFSLRSG